MLDHGQDLAGVAVDDHGHIAVAFAHRGLIDQQHPTTTAAAMLGHQRRPRRDQVHDQMPVKAMAANHRANRHDLGISDELASQTPSQTALEHDMVLQVTFIAVGTHEPAPDPHQRHTPPAHRQIPDHAAPPVMHRAALEPAERTTRARPLWSVCHVTSSIDGRVHASFATPVALTGWGTREMTGSSALIAGRPR